MLTFLALLNFFVIVGCLSDEACSTTSGQTCDLNTNLCTATWLADVASMIEAGERALSIAQTIEAALAEAANTPTGGTIAGLASILADLLALRAEEETTEEEAVLFTEAFLHSMDIVLVFYSGWEDIFRLETRYKTATAYLRLLF
jgi:hypothetical protein